MVQGTKTNWTAMTDGAIIKEIGNFVKHHRLNQNITQENLARDAGLNRWTIGKIENGEPISLKSLEKS